MELAKKKCIPCKPGDNSLSNDKIKQHQAELNSWGIVDNHHLKKEFKFKNFLESLDFVNKVGKVAEQEGHHPNISFTWGKAEITIYTHAIDGLHTNDFILAAKIDAFIDAEINY